MRGVDRKAGALALGVAVGEGVAGPGAVFALHLAGGGVAERVRARAVHHGLKAV